MIDLRKSREKIDEIDQTIVQLFEERMKIAYDVADYKIKTGKQVYDRDRELQKLEALGNLASSEFNRIGIEELFIQIMSISRKLQYSLLAPSQEEHEFEVVKELHTDKTTKVAFFGEVGSYTEQAMREYFGDAVEGISVTEFKKVMEMVKKEEVAYGVLPIENSSTGGITDIYDLLFNYENTIIGEHIIKVEHVLMGVEAASMDTITTVFSHPQAIMQSRAFFANQPHMKLQPCESTSSAAKKVQENGETTIGAIGSKRAANHYGLKIMAEGINQEDCNSTRFIIISKQQIYFRDSNKVSICFEVPHESGSLYNMLSHIIYNGLNMTKIESRPISGRTWEYRFFVEFEGNLEDAGVKNALLGIQKEASNLRILGNYHTL